MKLRTIAILGRPNVGKSTLFNRLVGTKKSIVSDMEGVTRDRVYGKLEWLNQKYIIIDTGGYIPKSNDIIENQVKMQAEIASREADIIIFVIDGRTELTSNDLTLSRLIKKTNKPVVLVVNKIDNLEDENNNFQFYEMGFNDFVCISSESGRNTGILLDKISSFYKDDIANEKEDDCISFAIVGMPNVGKSSLMNKLLKSNKSIVTNIAGTTRDSIDSFIKYYKTNIRIIDTAGLRKKSKIVDSIEFYSGIRTYNVIDESDVVAVMIDASKGFDNQDKNIIRYIIDKGKGLMILVNKWDLIENKDSNTMRDMSEDMILSYSNVKHYPIQFISVKNNLKVSEIMKHVIEIDKKRKNIIQTSLLNNFLRDTVNFYPPPSNKGKNIKINYLTQIHNSPPRFAFFSNYPELITESYRRFLENQLRDEFDLIGVPVKISIRKK